ncbi:MAG: FAD-dependent oxidoreductase [Flavobacteriales bacterium]|nr:FAD-dependent oxidoreductase [Flavobacteriales bacterium]
MKKDIVILGAGTAGTMMSNHLRRALADDWSITVIDQRTEHHYQPGYLFVPFGVYEPEEIVKPIEKFIPHGVDLVLGEIDRIYPDHDKVVMGDGKEYNYDILIIATGTNIAPEEIEGMMGPHWHKDVFDFYTLEGAVALRDKLRKWEGGKMVINIAEMPIKCPVAPLELAFLADAYFEHRGMRDKVELVFATPMSGAFTKPKATEKLDYLLKEKNIKIVPDFNIMSVDGENKTITDYGGEEISYDILVSVPTNKGSDLMERSGIGDEINYVPTDRGTLQTKVKENIFAIGDATNIPASKAGSVAHFEGEILLENILRYVKGEALKEEFDGHANCFIETGHGKALLIDFNYTHEPVTGTFPFPGVGPLSLLKESRMNHMGKMAFKWIYWNMLITGRHLPFVSAQMTEAGKVFDD